MKAKLSTLIPITAVLASACISDSSTDVNSQEGVFTFIPGNGTGQGSSVVDSTFSSTPNQTSQQGPSPENSTTQPGSDQPSEGNNDDQADGPSGGNNDDQADGPSGGNDEPTPDEDDSSKDPDEENPDEENPDEENPTGENPDEGEGEGPAFEVPKHSGLGRGYDLVGHTTRQRCLDFNKRGYSLDTSPSAKPSEFSVKLAQSDTHLSELLGTASSLALGFDAKKFGLELSASQQHFAKNVSDHTHVQFVVSVVNRRQTLALSAPLDPLNDAFSQSVLEPLNQEAKYKFRDTCGDEFIQQVEMGSSLHLVFDFDGRQYSKSNLEKRKAAVEAILKKVFTGSASLELSKELSHVVKSTKITLTAHQIGGKPGTAAGLTPSNAIERFNKFSQESTPEQDAVLATQTAPYPVPAIHNGHERNEVFADISGQSGPRANMRRWADLTVQVQARCRAWDDFSKQRPAECLVAKTELLQAMEQCFRPRQWESCVVPSKQPLGGGSSSSASNLLGWLDQHVEQLTPNNTEYTRDNHRFKHGLNVHDKNCLPSKSCFLDPYKGTGIGIGRGFSVQTVKYQNIKGKQHPKHTIHPNESHCVNSTAHLEGRKRGLKKNAYWRYIINLHGYCPLKTKFATPQ